MKDKEYLYVCERCLMAIESREGNLARKIYRTDEEDELDCTCDWCEESGFDELYQLIKGQEYFNEEKESSNGYQISMHRRYY